MLSRREWLGRSLGAGAALALSPELLRALQQAGGTLIQRAIPSSGEKLPVIGLTLANHASCTDQAVLREVLKTLADNGARFFDTYHANNQSEQIAATLVSELGRYSEDLLIKPRVLVFIKMDLSDV